MGLVTITNIEANSAATANMFNERFGAVADEINGNIEGVNIKDRSITAAKLATDVFQAMYPVGSLYFNANVDTNPASLLGFGTWEKYSQGQVLVGVDTTQTEFDSLGKSGGTKAETLTEAQMPVHNHPGSTDNQGHHSHGYHKSTGQIIKPIHGAGDANHGFNDGHHYAHTDGAGGHTHNVSTHNRGGGAAHNNLQPYVTVFIWRRIG